jgi:hypothetical protein
MKSRASQSTNQKGRPFEPPFPFAAYFFPANHAAVGAFNRPRVSIRVLIAAIERSTTLRESGVRYWVA